MSLIRTHFPKEIDITVWGPTQSGKDWLYRGFAKELEYYNHYNNELDFILQMKRGSDPYENVITESPSNISPTSVGEDYIHSFFRRPRHNNSGDNYSVGFMQHYINFHNGRGADLVAAIMDKDKYEQTYLSIARSQNLLILLDPLFDNTGREGLGLNENTLFMNTESIVDEYPEIALRPGLNKADYHKILGILLHELAESKVQNRHLAFCITKTDAMKIRGSDPWALLERVFGQQIFKLVNSYRNVCNIEAFATSAAGYTKVRGILQSNFANGKLIDETKWNPFNCAAPFFWIFQNREIEQIKNTSNFLNREHNLRRYIRYPTPRLTT